MLKRCVAFLFIAVAAVVTSGAPAAHAQDAKTVLSSASKAMGADNLQSIQYSGTATEFSFGQAVNPSAPWPSFVDTSYMRTVDYKKPGWRVERALADIPAGPQGRRSAAGTDADGDRRTEYAVGHAVGPVDDALRIPARGREQ